MGGTSRYHCLEHVILENGQINPFILCDDNGPFFHILTFDCGILTITNTDLDGNPYVPVGTVDICDPTDDDIDVEQKIFCDNNAGLLTPYMVAYEYDELGAITGTTITEIDGTTPYVVTGTTVVCTGEDGDMEAILLCDDDTEFLRHVVYNNVGTVIITFDTTLDPTVAYVVTGTVGSCTGDLDQLALNAINLVPNADFNTAPDERLTVDQTAGGVQISLTPEAATTHFVWRWEGGAGRVTFDDTAPVGGVDPAISNGHIIRNNDSGVWHSDSMVKAKFIANTGQDGVIHVSQFKPVVP